MSGKVCAIIGFGPGLGTAYAETFRDAGYDLGLLSRSGAGLDDAVGTDTSVSVRSYECDAGDPDNLKNALASVQADLCEIDVVICNADLAQFGSLDDVSEHQFEQSWRVGALGLVATAKLLGPRMAERGSGVILVSGATAALRGNVWATAFAPAKSAQRTLANALAKQLGLRGVQIYARQGIDLDRSTLAAWVGRAAFELKPVYEAMLANLKRSTKLFMDETIAPVLDPGRRKTKTGYFWALARDDRPWGGDDPPGVAFTYAPGRSGQYADEILKGFSGTLQVDGYAGYNRLLKRPAQDVQLAHCWAHARRKLHEVAQTGTTPIADEGLRKIAALYRIEKDIRSQCPEARRTARQARSKPVIDEFETWLTTHRARVSAKSPIGQALKYIAKYWDGLVLFLEDGRIELDSNAVERTIRPIALNRKNALFAGHDAGAQNWAMIGSLIETCKLNAVDPHAWLAETLTAIINGHKQSRIEELLPWNYTQPV